MLAGIIAGLIAQGLARYGNKRGVGVLFEALVRATSYMDNRRTPELYCSKYGVRPKVSVPMAHPN